MNFLQWLGIILGIFFLVLGVVLMVSGKWWAVFPFLGGIFILKIICGYECDIYHN